MKLIKPSFLIKEQEPGLIGIYRQIEYAGRICYKSSNKITEDSAKSFVDRMIKSGHGAMLEHGTVYLKVPTGKYSFLDVDYFDDCDDIKDSFFSNPYTRIHCQEGYYYISTNYRVLIENFSKEFISELLQYLCEPTEFHEKRITVHFVCDRGVSHEFVRHRVFSFAQESTRYCNYSKDKFSNEITYICPCWLDYNKAQELTEIANKDNKEVYRMGHDESLSMEERGLCSFVYDMSNHEHGYLFQISAGWTPQQARAVLPNSLKTELVMTGFVSDWKHFFRLRSRIAKTGKPHPQAQELADPLMDEFVKRGIMETLL